MYVGQILQPDLHMGPSFCRHSGLVVLNSVHSLSPANFRNGRFYDSR